MTKPCYLALPLHPDVMVEQISGFGQCSLCKGVVFRALDVWWHATPEEAEEILGKWGVENGEQQPKTGGEG